MLSREVFAVAVRVVPNVFGVLFSLKVSFQCIMIIQRKQGQEPDLEVLDPSAEQAPAANFGEPHSQTICRTSVERQR